MRDDTFRIAVVSGKLGGVDGVSLEVDKWIGVLQELGHEVFTVAGTYAQPLDVLPRERQFELPEFRFDSDFQRHVELQVFPHMSRRPPHPSGNDLRQLVEQIETRGRELGEMLHDLVKDNHIDVLIGQNTNAMPMTILGGVAMYYVATAQRVATIFHHHDFWWERSRFSKSRIETLLNRIMPPVDLGLEHVVISSYAAHILTSLKRVQPHIIPNCEDFRTPAVADEYNAHFRRDFGFSDSDLLIVQPTRIVPRKRIEDSVALVGRLAARFPELRERLQYIISLYQGDEPDEEYIELIRRTAADWGVALHIISDRVRSVRGSSEEGERLYTNRDVLVHADLVTYLPAWEGFGNALLESIAARVPVVTTTYLVYKTDIMTAGLRNIEVRDRYDEQGHLVVEDHVLEEIRRVVTDRDLREEIVEHNFQVAQREFSLDTLKERLQTVLSEYGDEIRASRKRIAKSRVRYSV
ncbi:MAG: glycosyltransferase family 4 protein [Alkalispirochaeta sp.]